MATPHIAIIGYGQFGRFMAKHLRPYAVIHPVTRNSNPSIIKRCDIVVFAVPFSGLAEAITEAAPYLRPETVIIDVTSVKQAPLTLLTTAFPQHEIIGTHPIFGPQSGKNGIAGLPIVITNASATRTTYRKLKQFLTQTLKLRVIEQTAAEHDHEMAHIQALTHFIGRALLTMNIQKFKTSTTSYLHLVELTTLLQNDSWELFKTIQLTNPEAETIRKQFLDTLLHLEQTITNEKRV